MICKCQGCEYKPYQDMWEKLFASLTRWQGIWGQGDPPLGITAALGRMLWLQDLYLLPKEEADDGNVDKQI